MKKHSEENTASAPGKILELTTTISLPDVKGGFDQITEKRRSGFTSQEIIDYDAI